MINLNKPDDPTSGGLSLRVDQEVTGRPLRIRIPLTRVEVTGRPLQPSSSCAPNSATWPSSANGAAATIRSVPRQGGGERCAVAVAVAGGGEVRQRNHTSRLAVYRWRSVGAPWVLGRHRPGNTLNPRGSGFESLGGARRGTFANHWRWRNASCRPEQSPGVAGFSSGLSMSFRVGVQSSLRDADLRNRRLGGEWVWLAGHGGQCGGDGLQVGLDVGGGGRSGGVGVAGVGASDAVAEVAFDPGQGGVPQPVGGDALGGHPRQLLAEAMPQVVIAAAGQRTAVAEAQQGFGGQDRTPA